MIKVVDRFLRNFDSLREHADSLDYSGVVNPVDGVLYPGISIDIPSRTQVAITSNLVKALDKEIDMHMMFMRLSLQGMDAPHQAHTDSLMGSHSMMLYLTRDEDIVGDAGTSFLRHAETGMNRNPETDEEVEIWARDTNEPDAWIIEDQCDMKANRACIFDSDMFHRAEPIGGFGDNPQNGRLVLTAFFDVK